jgi:hypothetical protein
MLMELSLTVMVQFWAKDPSKPWKDVSGVTVDVPSRPISIICASSPPPGASGSVII